MKTNTGSPDEPGETEKTLTAAEMGIRDTSWQRLTSQARAWRDTESQAIAWTNTTRTKPGVQAYA